MTHPYNELYSTDRHYFDDEPFELLMPNAVAEVLLVCSKYDRFMLEEDGRIEEQLYKEYVQLGLRRAPPRFTEVSTAAEALALLKTRNVDLVISMLTYGDGNTEFFRQIKELRPTTPVVVLNRFSRELNLALEQQALHHVDHVFSWLSNSNILLAIVKLIEDRLNVEHDVAQGDIQTIILVEDSVRYVSSYLPLIYRTVFIQAREQMGEGLNEMLQSVRMRGRPKILLARTYEEAVGLYERFRKNLLGVITDISYKRNGVEDDQAGLALCEHIRAKDPEIPLLVQSSQLEHKESARKYNAEFMFKNSTTLLNDLRRYIRDNYGFGDFVFRVPGSFIEVDRARNLVDLQKKLRTVPADSVQYHVTSHHFSKWLKARALYALARLFRPKTMDDFDNVEAIREFLIDTINNYRMHAGRGVIAQFERDKFDAFSVFQRIGTGSMGGKARGIAFINTFLKSARIMFRFEGIAVQIPKTVVLATDVFERFMEANNLSDWALADRDDSVILERFLQARLPDDLLKDLEVIVQVIRNPLAVRSSSLLEDSYLQPFAGVYSTYFTPNSNKDVAIRVRHLADAIKGVFASTYYRGSKIYAQATHNLIDEEKMAVIIQEVTGRAHGNLFYPSFSGVARSLNFYPIQRERPADGVANVALGMGKTIVDGGVSLRFSPAHPKKILQLSNTDMILKSTQQRFFAIGLDDAHFAITTDEAAGLTLVDVQDVALEPSVRLLLSTYDFQNHNIRDDPSLPGRKVVTFAPILKYGMFPLAEILKVLLDMGQQQMNVPVEIEFAAELDPSLGNALAFKFLQIRPIVEGEENETVNVDDIKPEDALVLAGTALGNGSYANVCDVVYVRPDTFNPAHTKTIVETVDAINRRMAAEDKGYILIGPGRWGSSDPWLGVPVKWSNITHSRIIVEAGLKNFHVEPSQGSHFFQNLTSFRVAYLTINPAFQDGIYDVAFLDAQPAVFEDSMVRHVRFEKPLTTLVNGRGAGGVKAAILKPGVTQARKGE
jgi:DNA-binding NarL/FixJ family response regulator